jgi:hypothetical protein
VRADDRSSCRRVEDVVPVLDAGNREERSDDAGQLPPATCVCGLPPPRFISRLGRVEHSGREAVDGSAHLRGVSRSRRMGGAAARLSGRPFTPST